MIGSNRCELAPDEQINWLRNVPFFAVNLWGIAAPFYFGVTWATGLVCLGLYLSRMFFITGFYHRYFSHRSYHMNRVMQFLAALCGTTAVQKGPVWWASHHRHHHHHSDQPEDVHSRKLRGLYWSHLGWILCKKYHCINRSQVPDLLKFPELVWLDRGRNYIYPPLLLALACYAFGGWPMLGVGFFTSTFLLYHGTFAINSFAHMIGWQRYQTGDESRNHWLLALVTLGEGWHNNHHHRQGREMQAEPNVWREKLLDITHWILVLMSKLRLISLRPAS